MLVFAQERRQRHEVRLGCAAAVPRFGLAGWFRGRQSSRRQDPFAGRQSEPAPCWPDLLLSALSPAPPSCRGRTALKDLGRPSRSWGSRSPLASPLRASPRFWSHAHEGPAVRAA